MQDAYKHLWFYHQIFMVGLFWFFSAILILLVGYIGKFLDFIWLSTLNQIKLNSSSMTKILCSVCTSKQSETKAILTSIKNRLAKLSHEYVPDFREETEAQSRGPSAFSRLLSLIFEDSNSSQQTILNCSHEKYSRYLRRKLKCDSQTFNQLCNELVEKAAQRSYHLENLTLQIKGLSDTCLRLAQMNSIQTASSGAFKLEQFNTVPAISSARDSSPHEQNEQNEQIERNEEIKAQQQNAMPLLQMNQMTSFIMNYQPFPNYTLMCFGTPQ